MTICLELYRGDCCFSRFRDVDLVEFVVVLVLGAVVAAAVAVLLGAVVLIFVPKQC